MPDAASLWSSLGWPLLRLLLGLAAGLLVANVLEALRWTRVLARMAAPLTRLAHMPPVTGAAFALAFVSPASANGLLSESHDAGALPTRALVLANLFNSLPAYLVHTPAIFLLTWPVLGAPAITYVGLTLLAACGRTGFTVLLARWLLPGAAPGGSPAPAAAPPKPDAAGSVSRHAASAAPPPASATVRSTLEAGLRTAWRRFCRRLPRLVGVTVPVYILMYLLQRLGVFAAMEHWLAGHMDWLAFLRPQAVGIIVLHFAAELGAALGAAGSLIATGALSPRDVVLALLVGNILSTPIRALRHQLPAYSGFFRPALALRLILANQALRAASMALLTWAYYCWTRAA